MPQLVPIRIRRDVSVDWSSKNPILDAGEMAYETDTNRFKVGNGTAAWNALDYFAPSNELQQMLDAAIEQLNQDGGAAAVAVQNHVDDLTPHPVYDDGPSFTLLYENAKV